MKIQRVWAVYYSATGHTAQAVETLAKALADALRVPWQKDEFTTPDQRHTVRYFAPEEIVVFGMPVYAGRLPNKLLPFVQEGFCGQGAQAVPIVTFGNRSFDDALKELCETLEANGFHTVAAAAIVAQHAFAAALAAGRPDDADLQRIRAFAHALAIDIERCPKPPQPISVPGRSPIGPYYTPLGVDGKPAKFLKAKPKTDQARCLVCGLCAAVCPMGAISRQDPAVVEGVCIKCQACITRCPQRAKYYDDEAFLSHKAQLEQTQAQRKESCFFPLAKEKGIEKETS
ncbi:MAG: EFR1 family ferrodoxin [Christensenellales bacterium]